MQQDNENLRSSISTRIKQQVQSDKKQSQQFKALFLKNLRLQSKQKGTNCCQIVTPILCLIFTFLMKTIAEQNLNIGSALLPLTYPIKFNDWTQFDQANINLTKHRNPLQWMLFTCGQNCNKTILGQKDGSLDGQPSGILGGIKNTFKFPIPFYYDPKNSPNNSQYKYMPFFIDTNNTNINEEIYKRVSWGTQSDLDELKKIHGFEWYPDGAYNVSHLNQNSIGFDVKVNDMRQLQILRDNGIERITAQKIIKSDQSTKISSSEFTSYAGMLVIINWLTSSFINSVSGKTMQSGIYFMPQDESGLSFVSTFINIAAVLIFPISLSLLFPVFLYTVVLEKQEKLIQMMKMNGMKISSYWLVYFVFNFILSFVTNVVFLIIGYFLTEMRFFTETSMALLIVVVVGWSLAQIGMAVFFQTFLSKSAAANIIGYLLSIWTSMIASTLSIGVYQYPRQYPLGAKLFAPLAFPRIIYLMLTGCSQGHCYGSISHIPDEMVTQITMLYMNFIIFFLLGAYLFQIIPQEFGVTRHPLFPLIMIKKFFSRKIIANYHEEYTLNQDAELKQYIQNDDEDSFSKKQRSEVLANGAIEQNPLVINNLRKLYYKQGMGKMYAAVKSFNLKIGKKETFGLLGPNGAGKTTLISMITGMFEPNYGNAWIGGYDIRNSIQKAQLQMGVCPQFDLLWPQLTVSEHLYFYARLKGIPRKQIDAKVAKAIEEVKLSSFTDFQSSSLSGGMKRRLSVAISLVGDPKIVFLDEPSTGLDPENRRQLWEVLSKCQKSRSILLTTHMMEEADALCNRVGIITNGVLRTVAPQLTLKKVYGGGYRVSISITRQERRLVERQSIHLIEKGNQMEDYTEDKNELNNMRNSINNLIETQEKQTEQKSKARTIKVCQFMQENFPKCELLKSYSGYLIFKVSPQFKVSQIFQLLQKMQTELQIVDVAITNSSLEDVFMKVVKSNQINGSTTSSSAYRMKQQVQGQKGQASVKNTSEIQSKKLHNQSSVMSKDRQSYLSNEAGQTKNKKFKNPTIKSSSSQ